MELIQLIQKLSDVTAYPNAIDRIEVRQTHISVVFLAGQYVYKLKKPVNLGFLDFSTLDKRRHFCEEEVRLNRRLAPTIYLGVVPIAKTAAGIQMEGEGDVIDWAVKMERLPEGVSLRDRLKRGEVEPVILETLARKIADFHNHAESGPHIAAFGRFNVVAQNARENFEQSVTHVGHTVSRNVFDRLQALTEDSLQQFQPLIEARAKRGVPRDTHGDLHLDHVYYFPERKPPNDLIIIDCIEFNERFRYSDPISDMAFLAMDLVFHGHRQLADVLASTYIRSRSDTEGAALLPFYVAYRAAIRGKVEGIELFEKEISEDERSAIRKSAMGHWLLALGELEKPEQRPSLVLIGGLPGSGKSTLAHGLAERGHFKVIRSDVVRKQLAGLDPNTSARGEFNEGIYTPEWTARTYAECLEQAKRSLFEGERVIVDASFADEGHRREFMVVGKDLCVPTLFLLCKSSPEVTRERLKSRKGDASDADHDTYERIAGHWQAVTPQTQASLHEICTDGSPNEALTEAIEILQSKAVRCYSRF